MAINPNVSLKFILTILELENVAGVLVAVWTGFVATVIILIGVMVGYSVIVWLFSGSVYDLQ